MPTATADLIVFVRVPAGAEAILGVYVDGVELKVGADFEVGDERIHFLTPVQRFRPITGIRVVLNALCIGLYNRGDTIDLRILRDGCVEVVRADTPPAAR